ncbi:MAG: hypothetical protein GXO40_00435 [Epsilonproteobacteria bacterium]|nr:hypothetical protein [Campylobacterota bacterium]
MDDISFDFKSAILLLDEFLNLNKIDKKLFSSHLQPAMIEATRRIYAYRKIHNVDMSKPELLRDVCFLGTCLYELKPIPQYYTTLVDICFFILSLENIHFQANFKTKIRKSAYMFKCNQTNYILSDAFYLFFKSHFRTL